MIPAPCQQSSNTLLRSVTIALLVSHSGAKFGKEYNLQLSAKVHILRDRISTGKTSTNSISHESFSPLAFWHKGCSLVESNPQRSKKGEHSMPSWAAIFLVVALIAGLLGFTGVAGTASNIASILFIIFLVAFAISLLVGRRGPVV